MSIKILHLPTGEDITNNTRKFAKTYTDGYISPSGDIVENYAVSYVPQDGDTNITVTFPPRQGTNDTFEILFESEEKGNLNNQTIQLEDFTQQVGVGKQFPFSVRIVKSVAETLNGNITNHIFNRQILVNKASTELTLGLRFALDTNRISFETLQETQKEIAVQLFLDNEAGESQLVPVNVIEANTTDTINLYKAVFVPKFEGQVQRSQAVRKGFGYDVNRPNSYIFEFNRTSTAGDVNDDWDITFNKTGYLDGFGNELLGTTQRLNVTSGEIVVEAQQYITRLTQNANEITNVSWEAPDGQINIPELSVLLYEFDSTTMTTGAQIRPEDIKQFYITVGGSGIDLNGITMNGQGASPESLTGTKKFGPFLPEQTVELFGTMQETNNVASLKLTHYAYLNETAEDGTPISSQLDTQESVFQITRQNTNVDDETVTTQFWPPTTLFTVNTGITPELMRVDRFNSTTGVIEEIKKESGQWTLDQLFDQNSQLQPVVLTYEFTIDAPTEDPYKDGKLQYRQYNPYNETRTDWYDVPNDPYEIVKYGINPRSTDKGFQTVDIFGDPIGVPPNNPLILPAEFMNTGQRKIRIGLVPFEWTTLRNVYEFRTVGLEDPTSIRSLDFVDNYLMEIPSDTNDNNTTIIPTDPSTGTGA